MSVRRRWLTLGVALLAFVLLPFAIAGARTETRSIEVLKGMQQDRLALASIIIGLLCLDVVAPVPVSLVAAACGAVFDPPISVIVITVGLNSGCITGYVIGRYGGAPTVERFVGPRESARLTGLSERYGVWSLVIARPVPVLAELSTVLAGAAAMPFARYVAATTGANFVLAAFYTLVRSQFLRMW